MSDIQKPKLLLFQFKYDNKVTQFQSIHRDDHVRCLSLFFDVAVINYNCDYQEICDSVAPDLVVFETGLEITSTHRLEISNTGYSPNIPKIAFMNADGCSEYRSAVISDMEQWGIDTCFAISLAASEHIPEISDNLFVWPNFIDPDVFRDFGHDKLITVMLTGSQSPRYPWRRKVYPKIAECFPSFVCPHAGYDGRALPGRMLHGEPYARALNASMVSPTCGSVVKDLVRKHFEIPGAKACLITERAPALEAAGFIDMQNCVFVDEKDVVDKLDYLFSHPEVLRDITNAGHALVQHQHTMRNRDQIYQWYMLTKQLTEGERIVQQGPFAPLRRVKAYSGEKNVYVESHGLHMRALCAAEDFYEAKNYIAAENMYREVLGYVSEFPEAKLKLAFCCLNNGNPRAALSWIIQPIRRVVAQYGAPSPDPIEWACLVMCLLCLGRVREAQRRARQFPSLRHPLLDRVRWAAGSLDGCVVPADNEAQQGRYNLSIHKVPAGMLQQWPEQLCRMLRVSGRGDIAAILERSFPQAGLTSCEGGKNMDRGNQKDSRVRFVLRCSNGVLNIGDRLLRPRPTLSGLDHPELWERIKERLSRHVSKRTARFSARMRSFLPDRR